MDPQAAWGQLLSAYAAGYWDQVEELASALLDWLDRDGFPPKILNCPDPGPEWDRAFTHAGCSLALKAVRSSRRNLLSLKEEK